MVFISFSKLMKVNIETYKPIKSVINAQKIIYMPLLDSLKSRINAFSIGQITNDHKHSIIPLEAPAGLNSKEVSSTFAILFLDIKNLSELQKIYGLKLSTTIIQCLDVIVQAVITLNEGFLKQGDDKSIIGIFSGEYKRSNAVKSAMQIQWGVKKILNPILKTSIQCGVGVGQIVTYRTKINPTKTIDNSDIIWLEKAKQSTEFLCKEACKSTIISVDIYSKMEKSIRIHNDKDPIEIWTPKTILIENNKKILCYETKTTWQIS